MAAKIGYTPSAAMTRPFDAKGISAVDYARQRQPKRIFIMLGSNTMGEGTNLAAVATEYKLLLHMLRDSCPKSVICVISIPPVTRDSSSARAAGITNETIHRMNEKLRAMAKELGEEYFDLNEMFSDSNGYFREDYAEQDGLHFMGRTYKVMLSALQSDMQGGNVVEYQSTRSVNE